jgi:tRNA threonylcarbamoyladenosine biosynthesis protein TsaE
MKEYIRTVKIKDEAATEQFGIDLAARLKEGDVIALIGDLGAGKTTLTKAIARGLGVTGNVSSPTFNIVKEYKSGRLPLYHFDAYRLSSGEELIDIGAEDYFYGNGVCVIEWADIVSDVIPEDAMFIEISMGDSEFERIYRCTF